MDSLKAVSLFCGCGGTDLGTIGGFNFLGKYYERNPVEIVYANDIEKSACDIFEKNFNILPDNRDIREVDAADIPNADIIIGGFPCQSFSIIAQNPKRLGIKDKNGQLFFEMCRILKAKQPKCFIAENVKGILSANDKQAFPIIIEEFSNAGYNVNYTLTNAADYGVPQRRERVIVVGIHRDLNFKFNFPKAPEILNTLRNIVEKNVAEKYYFSDRAVAGLKNSNKDMNKGRAQDLDKPCNTVGSHLAKVSLNSTDPVLFENGRYRRFTPREVARIQSFPESFQLTGSESAQYKALGNAVPPVMFWYLSKALSEQLLCTKQLKNNF